MTTLEEINQNLRQICPSLAKKIRQCASDEEASELLYSLLSEFIRTQVNSLRASLDARFPPVQERQSDLK
jgi:hypothetical protein